MPMKQLIIDSTANSRMGKKVITYETKIRKRGEMVNVETEGGREKGMER